MSKPNYMKSFDITKTRVPITRGLWQDSDLDYGTRMIQNTAYIEGYNKGVSACRKAIRERLKKLDVKSIQELQALYVKASPALQLLNKLSPREQKEFVCMKCNHQRKMNLLYAELFSKKLCQNCFRKGWRMNNLDGTVYLYKDKKYV